MSTLLIRNGRVIDPAQYLDEVRDVWIVDGRFAPEGLRLTRADETLDAAGLLVMPGLVDVHVHLREPGNEAAETIETGCAAALAGGYTSIICMPNTTPALDTPERLRAVLSKAAALRGPHVYALGAITVGRQGKALVDFAALERAGALGFTDDGNGVQDADLIRSAMEQCAALGKRIAEHCEVASRVAGGVMHRGPASERAKLPGIPAEAESEMVERDVLLCEQTGAALHLQHISAALSMNILRDARARGVNVTAEVTPHHLVLTDEHAADGGPNFKMNPPLRSERDRRELLRGVSDGILGIIATDHAPHTKEAKAAGFPRRAVRRDRHGDRRGSDLDAPGARGIPDPRADGRAHEHRAGRGFRTQGRNDAAGPARRRDAVRSVGDVDRERGEFPLAQPQLPVRRADAAGARRRDGRGWRGALP